MNVKLINELLLSTTTNIPILETAFPNISQVKGQLFNFARKIGLESLPEIPGLLLIRGARQLGKSTWLESAIIQSYKELGHGSVFYLNCDYLENESQLERAIKELIPLYSRNIKNNIAPRLFIDEITVIKNWEKILKRLYDSGETRNILIITTGSQARDLRRGKEKLPGRRGKLERSEYYFPPLSYKEFLSKAKKHFQNDSLIAYLLTGGSPLAVNELAKLGAIPEYVYTLTRDWILGECARAERSRNTLIWLIQTLWRIGPNPVALNQLAKDAGAANNTVIQGYIDLLIDSLALGIALPWNIATSRSIPKKAAKYPWINVLAAWSFSSNRPSSIEQFSGLSQNHKGAAWEWLVAQEIWRRRALSGNQVPELLGFSEGGQGSIDLISDSPEMLVEVKAGTATPQEFVWFSQKYPDKKLFVVSQSKFKMQAVQGISFEEFLLEEY